MPLRQRIRFFQQLAVLARAGVPLRTSLQRLQDRIPGRQIAILSQQIDAGSTIGEAFARAGFSQFEIHLITAGERSARLEDVFQHLADFWTRESELFQALVSQLYYPIAVLHLAIIVSAIVETAFYSWPVALVHLIEAFACYYAAGFILYTLITISWKSDLAQGFWLKIPIIGSTLDAAYAHRWITALRLEYSAGIPMPDAVADAWRASGYTGRDHFAREGHDALMEGTALSTMVQKWKRLPRDWVDFIETGEVSGSLEKALTDLEAEAGRNWVVAQKRMAELLPKFLYFVILMIVAAQMIFTIYGSIQDKLSPIYQALDSIQGK